VLRWIGDIDAWLRGAATALRPGGCLILVDFHPLFSMVDSVEPLALGFPYGGAEPQRFEETGSNADPDIETTENVTVELAHSLGEIVSAASVPELTVTRLREPRDRDVEGRGLLSPGDDGRYRLEVSGQRLPMIFALTAVRP
jgi:hypothetical protein